MRFSASYLLSSWSSEYLGFLRLEREVSPPSLTPVGLPAVVAHYKQAARCCTVRRRNSTPLRHHRHCRRSPQADQSWPDLRCVDFADSHHCWAAPPLSQASSVGRRPFLSRPSDDLPRSRPRHVGPPTRGAALPFESPRKDRARPDLAAACCRRSPFGPATTEDSVATTAAASAAATTVAVGTSCAATHRSRPLLPLSLPPR
ncbi:hypothetical protein BHE74_00041152 [Ensete ventricosum]|nr:hypothetical protein BHE74_00041152 [Ensete ventricosum]